MADEEKDADLFSDAAFGEWWLTKRNEETWRRARERGTDAALQLADSMMEEAARAAWRELRSRFLME